MNRHNRPISDVLSVRLCTVLLLLSHIEIDMFTGAPPAQYPPGGYPPQGGYPPSGGYPPYGGGCPPRKYCPKDQRNIII